MRPEVIHRCTQELAFDPQSLAFISLAEELRSGGELQEALAVARRGADRHKDLADAHDVLARILADVGEGGQARSEWEAALQIDPQHVSSLKGLGFLAWRAERLPEAERYLSEASRLSPHDAGLAVARARIAGVLEPPAQAAPSAAEPETPTFANGRELFAQLLGDADRTALLVDRDGLVLAGAYVDEHGKDVAEEVGAELTGVSDEAARALDQLGLGTWKTLLMEAQHAAVGLAPIEGSVVLVAAARDTQVGLVRRLLERARSRASLWLRKTAQ